MNRLKSDITNNTILLTSIKYQSFNQLFYNNQYQMQPKMQSYKKTTQLIITSYLYLLSTLQLMNDNNIIHANINEDAIVFNQTNQPLLSNFFLSFDSQKINEERKSNLFQISLQKLEQTNQIPSFQLFVNRAGSLFSSCALIFKVKLWAVSEYILL